MVFSGIASGFEHAFQAARAVRQSPDPRRWQVDPPTAGTREPLRVRFGAPLDHALASRMLAVFDQQNGSVAGRAELTARDSAWRFTPAAPWPAVANQLRVDARLEDIAGNSVERVFDADRARGALSVEQSAAVGPVRVVLFTPRTAGAAVAGGQQPR